MIDYKKIKESLDYIKETKNIIKNMEEYKSPSTKVKHVGLEIEACSPYPRAFIKAQMLKLGLQHYCDIGSDGSIDPDPGFTEMDNEQECDEWGDIIDYSEEDDVIKYLGGVGCYPSTHKQTLFELRVLTTEVTLPIVLSKLQTFFTTIKATTNKSCGLHVHLDMRNRDVAECYKRLFNKLPEMETMVDNTRIGNTYCVKNICPTFQQDIMNGRRHSAINTRAYNEHSTLEVRLHEGCVDAKKILKWCNYLISVVDNKKAKKGIKRVARKRLKTA